MLECKFLLYFINKHRVYLLNVGSVFTGLTVHCQIFVQVVKVIFATTTLPAQHSKKWKDHFFSGQNIGWLWKTSKDKVWWCELSLVNSFIIFLFARTFSSLSSYKWDNVFWFYDSQIKWTVLAVDLLWMIVLAFCLLMFRISSNLFQIS